MLGLHGVRNSRIGDATKRGISGGQRRRVTLAKGLISGPAILFGDEITSGLSATDSLLALRACNSMSRAWDTSFLLVVHQPRIEVWRLFDRVLCFSRHGKAVYQGEVSALASHLEAVVPSPANADDHGDTALPDRLLDLATADESALALEEAYTKLIAPPIIAEWQAIPRGTSTREVVHTLGELFMRPRKRGAHASACLQLRVLQARDWRMALRDWEFVGVSYGSAAALGLLLGLVFFQVRSKQVQLYQSSFLFMSSLTAALFSFNYLPMVISEKAQFSFEMLEKAYATPQYAASKAILVIFSAATIILVFSILAYFLAGFEPAAFGYYFLLQMLGFLATDGLLSVIASSTNSHESANALAAFVITATSLFNGFTANAASMPIWLSWIQYLSPFFYTYSALAAHFFLAGTVPADQRVEPATAASLGLDARMAWVGPVVLFAMAVVLRASAVAVLHYTRGGVVT